MKTKLFKTKRVVYFAHATTYDLDEILLLFDLTSDALLKLN